MSTRPESLSSAWKQRLRRRLLNWYRQHARDLPWRRSRDPYGVWVSEIMLQQTQVETVRKYFERFLNSFPTVERLAAADEQQVLRQWEGLGYYRRARQMHTAARVLVEEFDGQFPRDAATLEQLPGIGRYTAGAIASIAFDERAPILEANTIRLLSRLLGYREDPTRSTGQRLLWQTAEAILPRVAVSHFNQALMEVGSLVCTPSDPNCVACPLSGLCVAHERNWQHEIPNLPAKAATVAVHEAVVVIKKQHQVLIRQCADGERWAGLWDFPRVSVEAEQQRLMRSEILSKVISLTGVRCRLVRRRKTIKHAVTRFRITLDCYDAEYNSGSARSSRGTPMRWVDVDRLAEYPLSTTGRKVAGLLAD